MKHLCVLIALLALASCQLTDLSTGVPLPSATSALGPNVLGTDAPPPALAYATNTVVVYVGEPLTLAPTSGLASGVLFSAQPALPQGVTLDSRTGVLSALTPAPLESAPVAYTLTALNARGRQTFELTLSVASPFHTVGQSLAEPRYRHATLVLPDGRLFTVGGLSAGGSAGSELFDPATGVSTLGPALLKGRYSLTATLVTVGAHVGQVLVANGDTISGSHGGQTEFFDPASPGAFTPGPTMKETRRGGVVATTLDDGKILFTGGGTYGVASAELYDPATDSFRYTGAPGTYRTYHQAVKLPDGRVLVTGGYGVSGTVAASEVYDPATDTFTPTGDLAVSRQTFQATVLADGRVLVTGGTSSDGGNAQVSEVWDPTANAGVGAFSAAASLAKYRWEHFATRLPDGRVLVAGGDDFSGLPLRDTEIFDPATGQFTATGLLAAGRDWSTLVTGADGRLYFVGGTTNGNPYYEASIETWK